jgi:hypothetical protein
MKAYALVLLVGCHGFGGGVAGSGTAKTEVRTVGAFSALDISGAIDTDVAIGSEARVEISGDDNLLPLITTELHGDTLEIGTRQNVRPRQPLLAHITVPRLTAVGVSGSGNVAIHGVHGDSLALQVTGSATVRGDGAVHGLTINVTGSGDLQLEGLAAERASVTISGSGDARLAVSRALDVHISGSGDVSYRGDPEVKKDISGSGTLARR